MAFQSGSQVNPALGRTDFTPFLQGAMQGAQAQARGAENIAAGLAGLGQQAAAGMREQYKEAKELKLEERKYKDTIASGMKILDVLSKTPDIPESVKKLLPQLTQGFGNPNVPLSEQAASATTLGNIFGAVLSSGLKTTMENAADNAAAQYANAVTAAGGRPFSMVTPVSATAQARGEEMAAKLANLKSETNRNLAAAQPKTNEAPAGYRFDPQGNLVAIPGGPAAVAKAAQEEAAARAERALKLKEEEAAAKGVSVEAEKTAKEASMENMKKDAESSAQATFQEIQKAKKGVNKWFSQGLGSGVAGFFSGSAANDLEASYTVIGANQALKQIMDLKRISPTGSTGLGALNMKELEVLQSRFAKLTTRSSDKFALEALNDLEKVITTAFPNLAKEKKSSGQTGPGSKKRYEVISTSQD